MYMCERDNVCVCSEVSLHSVHRVMMGLMLPTWFLSMWISNTATASMMIPIVEAILTQFKAASNSGTFVT